MDIIHSDIAKHGSILVGDLVYTINFVYMYFRKRGWWWWGIFLFLATTTTTITTTVTIISCVKGGYPRHCFVLMKNLVMGYARTKNTALVISIY